MKKEHRTEYLLIIIFMVAFFIGVLGFLTAGVNIGNAVFNTLTMYVLNYTNTPDNILINIARYLAAIFTLGAILSIFSRVVVIFSHWSRSFRKKSTLVFGENVEADNFAENIGICAIRSREFCKAKRYVLLGEEKDNLNFYYKYKEQLADKPVYVRCNSFSNRIVNHGLHKFFSLEELIARRYWYENTMIEDAYSEDAVPMDKLTVVFPIFNSLTEELLYQATQTNIYDVNQVVEYHIFGDTKAFCQLHQNLDALHIVAHNDEVWDSIQLLKNSDRIVLCCDENSVILARDLVEMVRCGRIDIITEAEISEELLRNTRSGKIAEDSMKINIFQWPQAICTEESIISDEKIYVAQLLNKSYYDEYNEGNTETAGRLWEELDTFDRYSNLAAADYQYIRLLLMQKWNKGIVYNGISDIPEYMMTKNAELEHLRWCNYHLYNSWTPWIDDTFSKPLKDKAERKHKDLRPFSELPDVEKEKDKLQIKYLFDAYDKSVQKRQMGIKN